MGNVLQRFASTSDNEVPTPPMEQLTPAEVQIIKETWKIPRANSLDSAEHIFFTFLERFPENQQKFAAFKDVPLASLRGTVGFRAHASKIFNVFDNVVDALDKDPGLKGIKQLVVDVAKFHRHKKISKKAHNDLRGVLIDVLMDVCKLNDEGKVAWTKLLSIFFHIMFECADGRVEQFV